MSERMRRWVMWCVPALVLVVSARQEALGQVAARKVIAEGEVTANDVYVRSGDSLNHYTICKLSAGARVQIVGERGDWYEILPPSEAFSLISGDYVDSTDGRSGIVNGNNVRVRSGSVLNENKYTVQLLLDKGAEVTIRGRNPDGFLKIEPPTGATVWVSRSFVEKVSGARAHGESTAAAPADPVGAEARTQAGSSTGPTSAPSPAVATDPDAVITKSDALARIDTTPQRDDLARIDAAVNLELQKPVAERQLGAHLKRYEAVARQTEDVVAQKYAQARVTQVSDMIALIDTVRQMRRLEEEAASKRRGFQEGRAGIRTVTPSAPTGLDAQGVLRRSAVYPEGSPIERYRLVERVGGDDRTIAYIEVPGNSSLNAESLVGQYIGVRASARRWQQDSVHPLPIYVAGEFVILSESAEGDGASEAP